MCFNAHHFTVPILFLCIDFCWEESCHYNWDVVARTSISCKELLKLLKSDAASVSRQDFHAEIETTILEGKKTCGCDRSFGNFREVTHNFTLEMNLPSWLTDAYHYLFCFLFWLDQQPFVNWAFVLKQFYLPRGCNTLQLQFNGNQREHNCCLVAQARLWINL